MLVQGNVTAATDGRYQVQVQGQLSAKIPALRSSYRLKIHFEAKTWEETPPQIGDKVLCYFPDAGYLDGYILGLLEG